jgi:hypothetical protein
MNLSEKEFACCILNILRLGFSTDSKAHHENMNMFRFDYRKDSAYIENKETHITISIYRNSKRIINRNIVDDADIKETFKIIEELYTKA